jgi:hypothetical protein
VVVAHEEDDVGTLGRGDGEGGEGEKEGKSEGEKGAEVHGF